MAIYQYNIIFLPEENRNEIPSRTSESFDDVINSFWRRKNISFSEIESRLNSFVKPTEWSKDIADLKNYGNSDTNDIHIGIDENDHILEFSCRFDLRDLDIKFVKNVLSLSNNLHCVALDIEGNLFEPSFENLVQNIEKSDALKFVGNPKEFLTKLTQKRT
jgi:hypothetical protein